MRPVVAPKVPQAQRPLHVATVNAELAPKYPALHWPLQAAVVKPVLAPNVPAGQAFCVAEQEPAPPQCPALMAPSQVEAVRTVVLRP